MSRVVHWEIKRRLGRQIQAGFNFSSQGGRTVERMSWLWLLAAVALVVAVHTRDEARARRSDDSSPLQAVVEDLSRQVSEHQARLTAVERTCRSAVWNVAFHTHIQDDTVSILPSAPIIYNVVLTNIGNAYDDHTGMFTAPVAGTYSFTITCMAVIGTNVALSIVVDDQAVATCWSSGSTTSDLGSTTAAMHVSTGKRAWVRQGGTGTQMRGTVWAVFSGFLIKADT